MSGLEGQEVRSGGVVAETLLGGKHGLDFDGHIQLHSWQTARPRGVKKLRNPFELLKRRGWKWRLVYDPSFTSARKRAQKGHDVLDDLPSSRTEEDFLTHQP